MAGDGAAAPKVKALACSGCGAPLTVRGFGQTETIVCAACGSILDLGDENLRIISQFAKRTQIRPLIELGRRGSFFGEMLEVIGYLRRKIVVEGMPYEWGEYLLFNPYKGFRWLNEYNGHWTFIRTLIERPDVSVGSPRYLDRQFEHFQTANAEVSYVIGEFFWRVEVGERANVEDFVAPPYMLSRESSEKEVVWSLGQYVEPDVVWKAFQPGGMAPLRVGVAPCQPAPYKARAPKVYGSFLLLLVAAIVIHLFTLASSSNRLVYRNAFVYRPSALEKSLVTDVFEISGRTSNVVVKSHAEVSNDWIYLNLTLIDEATGHGYDFGREISYYFGSDSDGSWSEGSQDDRATLSEVPPGRYYLRIEPEGAGSEVPYVIEVRRDVPGWLFFFLAIITISAYPVLLFWRQRMFEVQRWSESDHPIFESSDD